MLHLGDSSDVLKTLLLRSVDALVIDPPAGIGFMSTGKDHWDSDRGGRDHWIKWFSGVMREAFQVMKPGAHGFVWALPRTSHWTATALEDAGFEIRDVVVHLFGSGFPKSHDVSKGIDKRAGAEREIVPLRKLGQISDATDVTKGWKNSSDNSKTTDPNPITPAAKKWAGWGSALKPAQENWILIRRPLEAKLGIAENVLKWGTGGINIDASRIGSAGGGGNGLGSYLHGASNGKGGQISGLKHSIPSTPQGRFPSNLILSHSDDCVEVGTAKVKGAKATTRRIRAGMNPRNVGVYGKSDGVTECVGYASPDGTETVAAFNCTPGCAIAELDRQSGTTGGASRFFYCAKPSKREKNAGCEGMPLKRKGFHGNGNSPTRLGNQKRSAGENKVLIESSANHHPCVKSLTLMKHLIRMITPPGGTVLDCFAGSGSTGVAAISEGFNFIGIEKEPEYFEIAKARIEAATACPK